MALNYIRRSLNVLHKNVMSSLFIIVKMRTFFRLPFYMVTAIFLQLEFVFSVYPVAVFYGIAQNCEVFQLRNLVNQLKLHLGTDQVKCITIGNGFFTSFLKSFNYQADEACRLIREDPMFQSDFAIVGISQGGLIGRSIIEKCNTKGTVRRYISVASPQMGVAVVPKLNCGFICGLYNRIVGNLIYTDFIQKNVGPSGYYKDKDNYYNYINYSSFLADLNNERKEKNSQYKERMLKLEKMMLVMSAKDTIVFPKSSAWFEFYDRRGKEIIPLKESEFYKQDFIGIRELDEQGKLYFVKLTGRHTIFTDKDIINYFVPLLK